MTDPTTLQRPRQVTMAAWLVMAGSALVVVTVFETIIGLRDLETRQGIERFLAEPPGNGLGLDLQGALQLLRVVSMVAAGCAAAAVILGFHVLKRSRGARLGLTVLAVPLFLSGMVAGGFLSSLVAAAAAMLWLEPARDWFDGRPPREPARRPEAEPPEAPRAAEPTPVPPPEPRPHEGFGRPPAEAASWPAPTPHATSGPLGAPGRPARRPDTVLWACILTWVFAGLAALLMGVSAIVLAASPDLVLDELNRQDPELARQGLTERTVQLATWVTAGVTVVWALVAALSAVLVFRGSRWGRMALVGSTAAAALVLLLASFSSVVMVLPLLACVATFSLLLRPDVRAWCSRA